MAIKGECSSRVVRSTELFLSDIKVGYACNNRCLHCVIADERRALQRDSRTTELSKEECFRLMEHSVNTGIGDVILTGGEISVRTDFQDIVAEAARLGLRVTIQTNGRAFSRPEIVSKVARDVHLTVVALHGPNQATHDKITRVAGSFKETISGIRNLRSEGVPIIIKTVVTRLNVGVLCRLVQKCQEMEIDELVLAYIHGQGDARRNYSQLAPTFTELKPTIQLTQEQGDSCGVSISFEAFPLCQLPRPWRAIELLYFVSKDSLFTNVGDSSREWRMTRRAAKKKGRRCGKCDWEYVCEGVWKEYIEQFGDGELEPRPFNIEDVVHSATMAKIFCDA